MTLGYTNECKKEKKINGERLKKRITNRNRQDTAADNRSKKTKQKANNQIDNSDEIEIPEEIEIKSSEKMLKYNECGQLEEGEASYIDVWSNDIYANWQKIYRHESKEDPEETTEDEKARETVVMIYELDDYTKKEKEQQPD